MSGDTMSGVEYVARLHAVIDQLTAPLEQRHAARLRCAPGCVDCCVDDLTVIRAEADLIRERHAALLSEERPHASGACAMLSEEGRCRVYADRPYVCRTQGLPLRWAERDGEAVREYRDICPLNATDTQEPGGGIPVEELAAEDCWTIGPIEARLNALDTERVALRALFDPSDPRT